MLNRRITRCIFNTTEVTESLSTPDLVQYAFAATTADSFYVGFHGKFASRYIQVHTANTNSSVMTVEYWDGSLWQDVDDLVDQTSSAGKTFAQSGFISWENKDNWTKRSLTGMDSDIQLYWVKITVSANLSATTKLHAVLNLFSDDNMLRVYAPELMSDTNYLPSGKTNFLQQHMAAKDLVVLRLKTRKWIEDESQVIDINDVSIPAVYACAWIILAPIATSDAARGLRDQMKQNFEDEIAKVNFAVDQNQDGVIEENEREQISGFTMERR